MCLSVPDGRPVFYPSRAFDDASRRRMRNRRCTPPSACKADRPGRAWGLAASSSAPRVRRRPPMLTCETTPQGSFFKCYLSGKQRRRPGRSGFKRGGAKCRRPTGGRPPMVGLSEAGDGRPLRASIQPVKRIPCLRRATVCWREPLGAAHAPFLTGNGQMTVMAGKVVAHALVSQSMVLSTRCSRPGINGLQRMPGLHAALLRVCAVNPPSTVCARPCPFARHGQATGRAQADQRDYPRFRCVCPPPEK